MNTGGRLCLALGLLSNSERWRGHLSPVGALQGTCTLSAEACSQTGVRGLMGLSEGARAPQDTALPPSRAKGRRFISSPSGRLGPSPAPSMERVLPHSTDTCFPRTWLGHKPYGNPTEGPTGLVRTAAQHPLPPPTLSKPQQEDHPPGGPSRQDTGCSRPAVITITVAPRTSDPSHKLSWQGPCAQERQP